MAAIIPAADLQQLEQREDCTIFEEVSQAYRDQPLEQIEREVERAVREARKRRARQLGTDSQR